MKNPNSPNADSSRPSTLDAPKDCLCWRGVLQDDESLGGLPNTKSQRFSNAISQIAPLPLVVALNRNFKSQIAARYAAFWHAVPQIALASFLLCL